MFVIPEKGYININFIPKLVSILVGTLNFRNFANSFEKSFTE